MGVCPNRSKEPPAGVEPLAYAVFQSFMQASHTHRQLMVRASQTGGPLHYAGCLRLLSQHDGATQRDIAEWMHLSRPSVTGMVQQLEREGAIVRKPDEKDQRLTRVFLTAEGREMAERMRSRLLEHVNDTFGRMGEDDLRELGRLLDELSALEAEVLKSAGATDSDEDEVEEAR